ncbi:MAG: hypothetical protein WDN28_27340 [Chthoniobacter sp.]
MEAAPGAATKRNHALRRGLQSGAYFDENILRNVLTVSEPKSSFVAMKKVLSLLIAFVFLQVQSWALSGGPQYGGNKGNPSIIGTYGGVFIPTSSVTADGSASTSFQAASIGIFSLSIPETDISIGIAIVFVQGVAFIGQMAGVADADKQSIQGLVAGTSSFDVSVPFTSGGVTTFKNFPVEAQGSFKANVIEGDAGAFTQAPAGSGNGTGSSSSNNSGNLPAEIGSTNAARLQGTAQIGTFFLIDDTTGEPLVNVITSYSIDGIKQSNIPSNVTTVPFTFSGGSSNSN